MFNNLIRKFYADNVELNLGAGGKTIATDDIAGIQHELVKVEFGADGSATQVSAANPLPVTDAVAEAALASIAAEDFATAANQGTEITALAAILAKLSADPATQTTLAAILAKIIAAPATAANQNNEISLLSSIDAGTAAALGQAAMADSVPVVIASDQNAIPVSGTVTVNTVDNTQLYSATLVAAGAIDAVSTTGYASLVMQLVGTWEGNLIVEGSQDPNNNFLPLFVLNANEISMQDIITENGTYQIKTTTKWVRLNVFQLSGSLDVLILGRTVPGLNGADMLSLAMDRINGTPLYVEETATKKDIRNALIPSDAPANITAGGSFATGQLMFLVDTIGYQSLSLQVITLPNATTVTGSNDGVTWVSIIGTAQATTTASASLSIAGSYSFPAVTRFIRAVCPVTGVYSFNIYLRQTPGSLLGGVGTPINLQSVGGTAAVLPTGVISTGAAGSFAGLLGVGSNTTIGSTTVPNPIIVGGREAPSDGALGGKVRTLLTDTLGKAIVTGDISASQSTQNVKSVPVQDTSQFEGQSFMELLAQILLELKINNQYMSDLPLVLRGQSGSFDEPQQFRNDNSLFAIQ